MADYLAERGPEGVLNEVQDFARRRPGAFLAAALATGFVVGRLGKGVVAAGSDRSGYGSTKPRTDAFISDVPRLDPEPSYPTAAYPDSAAEPLTSTTEYAATGTGTPVQRTDPYAAEPYAAQPYSAEPVPPQPSTAPGDPRVEGSQR